MFLGQCLSDQRVTVQLFSVTKTHSKEFMKITVRPVLWGDAHTEPAAGIESQRLFQLGYCTAATSPMAIVTDVWTLRQHPSDGSIWLVEARRLVVSDF